MRLCKFSHNGKGASFASYLKIMWTNSSHSSDKNVLVAVFSFPSEGLEGLSFIWSVPFLLGT